jgi:valyl-tRNA synthetase
MPLPKRYNSSEAEPRLAAFWEKEQIYQFNLASTVPVYSIDTPPPASQAICILGMFTRTAIPILWPASTA